MRRLPQGGNPERDIAETPKRRVSRSKEETGGGPSVAIRAESWQEEQAEA